MFDVIDQQSPQTRIGPIVADAALSPLEAVASLSAAVSGAWQVEQAVDPFGEVSIIVLPTFDDPALPTFMLYEEHGLARMVTIRDDIWESDQAFPSGRRAVAAIIAAASADGVAA